MILNLSLRKTSRKHSSKKYTSKVSYPFYRNMYKLNVSRIHNLVSKLESQLKIYSTLTTLDKHKHKHILPLKLLSASTTPKYYIIKSSWNSNLELTNLTDYFSEECRIQCVFKKNLSPLEYWNTHREQLIAALKRKKMEINIHNLREEMYIYNKPCNNFRIPVCLEILKLFKPKKWLDISAGWGDRLLSALLYKPLELYCGVDPNPCLHPCYNKMIKTFGSSNTKYILIEDGFETAKLPDTTFDLIFSSPPFFDLEIYSNASTNSITKYQSQELWFNEFLMKSIHKAINYLSVKGYLVLYMGEAQGTTYIPRMIKLINEKLKNIGELYYTDNGTKLRPFYCWCKI